MNKNKKSKIKLFACLTCAFIALALTLSGCAGIPGFSTKSNSNEQTPAEQNRAYMSKVNQAMTDLGTNLTTFIEAVTRGDAISMKTQSDKAMNALDEIKNIEAPETMQDVKAKYDGGCENLKQALKQYVDLYTSGAEITQEALAPIQQLYDSGVNSLKEADEAVSNISSNSNAHTSSDVGTSSNSNTDSSASTNESSNTNSNTNSAS